MLKDQPDLEKVPARARSLIGRRLEKDPKMRLRDIGSAASLVENRDSNGVGEGGVAAAIVPTHLHSWFHNAGWITVAIFAAVALALGLVSYRHVTPHVTDLCAVKVNMRPN